MKDPKHKQIVLVRPKGRPEYGRKLINNDYKWVDNDRKSRSVWTTKAESEILKKIMDIFKNDPNYKNITLGEILDRYLEIHEQAEIKEHEVNWQYKPFAKP